MIDPHPPIIIFDLDGVLLNSQGHLLAAFEALRYPWIKWNQPLVSGITPLDIIRMFEKSAKARSLSSLRAMTSEFMQLIPGRIRRITFFIKFKRQMEKYDWKYNEFFPGTIEMIRNLSEKGILFGAASNSFGNRVEKWFEYKRLNDIIQCVVTRDDRKVLGVKPNPRVLLGLLVRMKQHYQIPRIDRNLVAFVGDNVSDIIAAKLAKVKSIGVLSGHASKTELEMMEPDFLLKSVIKIPTILNKLFPEWNER
ncbi:HAD family hydrolase [Candidatus Harpocratesius sp.]